MFHIDVNHDTHPRVLRAAVALLIELLGEPAQTEQLAGALGVVDRIAPTDRPDVGVIPLPSPVSAPAPASWPSSIELDLPPRFYPPQAPAQGGAPALLPLPSFAPSTAGAPAWSTALGALMGSSVPLGPAAPSPAPQFVPSAAAPAAAPTASPAGIVLDAKGLPWDGRIHSTGKSKIENGTWKLKKGVGNDVAFVSRVEAELRQVVNMQVPPAPTQAQQQPAPTQAPQFVLPPAPTPVQQQQQQQPAPTPVQQQQSAPTPLPQVQWQQPQAPQNISGPQTFADFNAAISAATSTGQISVTRLLEVVAELGLPSVPMLQHRPELVPIAWAKLTGQMV